VHFESQTAQVELKSGRVYAPASCMQASRSAGSRVSVTICGEGGAVLSTAVSNVVSTRSWPLETVYKDGETGLEDCVRTCEMRQGAP